VFGQDVRRKVKTVADEKRDCEKRQYSDDLAINKNQARVEPADATDNRGQKHIKTRRRSCRTREENRNQPVKGNVPNQ